MFRRSFMQAYKIRKYGLTAAQGGNVSTNIAFNGFYELRASRIGVFLAMAFIMISATGDFQFFYQVTTHVKQPYHKILYENSIPKAIKEPNDQIIQNYKTIDDMKQFLRSFDM